MIFECGYWDVEAEPKINSGKRYFVCKHRFNPSKIELVFIKEDKLEGKKELIEFIEKEILKKA